MHTYYYLLIITLKVIQFYEKCKNTKGPDFGSFKIHTSELYLTLLTLLRKIRKISASRTFFFLS